MTVIDQLASSLGKRDEAPNQALAAEIVKTKNETVLKELFKLLHHKSKDIQSDSIKVIYEVAEKMPELVAKHSKELVALLENKNNRLQWGAMTALDAIAAEDPKTVYASLAKIIAVADQGSVITNDHCVGILIKLCQVKTYRKDAFDLLVERLLKSPVNQLPMYAENALPIINAETKVAFLNVLSGRLGDIEKESKRKRVEKVIQKLQKL
jgi:hypothetical protein